MFAQESEEGQSTLAVQIAQAPGVFGVPTTIDLEAGQVVFTVLADFNGDGRVDVAVGDLDGARLLVLLGNGDGTFGEPSEVPLYCPAEE